MSDGTTHYKGCFESGPRHYECALQEIGRLRLTVTHLQAELEKKTWFSAYEKKEWVGLTHKDIEECLKMADHNLIENPTHLYWGSLVKIIEVKLRQKNNG